MHNQKIPTNMICQSFVRSSIGCLSWFLASSIYIHGCDSFLLIIWSIDITIVIFFKMRAISIWFIVLSIYCFQDRMILQLFSMMKCQNFLFLALTKFLFISILSYPITFKNGLMNRYSNSKYISKVMKKPVITKKY